MRLIRNPILPRIPDNKDVKSLEQWERDIMRIVEKLHEDMYDEVYDIIVRLDIIESTLADHESRLLALEP